MTNEQRIQALQDRLDRILESVPDNPIYEEHESRSVLNYIQSIKILKETRKEESYGFCTRSDG